MVVHHTIFRSSIGIHVCRFFAEVIVYAIFESGGRQYRAEEGQSFSTENLPYEVGEQIELENVLLLAKVSSNITSACPLGAS